ncbi:MAG: type II secretion system F family protein [Pseudomonas sp.]|uniref:type II secretion system F family protein n=1 Tax=Pseudomonas sp. TaxID=306 RepID=UPI003D0FE604
MSAPLLLGLMCFGMLGMAMFILRRSWHQARAEQVLDRLGKPQLDEVSSKRMAAVERMFLRAGLGALRERMGLLLIGWGLGMFLGLVAGGWPGLLLMLVFPPLALRLFLAWRYRKRVGRMVQQLPQMLDQVVRSLQTGRTLGDAVVNAIGASPEPLCSALGRVQRSVQLGVSLPDALQDTADLYEQEELRILAIGVRVNYRYGGSASDLLGNLIKVIHEREQIARQLRAMTGETRLTAVVLAVLPVLMAGYILGTNPDYLMSMWEDSGGQKMLIGAFAMQVMGCLALWRMLRSV